MPDQSQEMDKLEAQVGKTDTVIDSAIAAFAGVAEQIRVAAGDRAKSLALAADLDARGAALAAAIPANTPADPGTGGGDAGGTGGTGDAGGTGDTGGTTTEGAGTTS